MASQKLTEARQVTLAQAEILLEYAMRAQKPTFLWAGAGIGKSSLVHQIAKKLGGISIDLRMANLQQTDLMGIPYYSKERDTMVWAHPVSLPTQEFAKRYKKIVLFLDEMNTAAPAVQASAYQLVLDRTVGEYKLPDNVVIVAAGNRESDQGVTYRMPAPLRNRFIHLEVRSDYESWFNWATTEGDQHPDVVGFISFSKDSLSDFDNKSSSRAFATPRSWSFASDILKEIEKDHAADDILSDLLTGTVGEGLAVKFMAYRSTGKNLPRPSEVLEGRVTELKTRDISAQYSMLMSLNYELRELWFNDSASEGQDSNGKPKRKWKSEKLEKEWMLKADRFMEFIMKNFNEELAIMAARIALKQYNLPFMPGKLKSFPAFTGRFGKFITSAGK